uniref:N-acetylmuramoyl-L-alanine amidase n=1 Tax=Cyanothece sp. (strain PCC 7425 / ATCC 29141) TaxID=395961 RepID=B8HPP1_CYAP4
MLLRFRPLLALLFALALGLTALIRPLWANPNPVSSIQDFPNVQPAPLDQQFSGPETLPDLPNLVPPLGSLAIARSNSIRQEVILAHPTNFGPRFSQDVYGRPVRNAPLVVLHETVGSGSSAIQMFRSPQPDESRQASYHALILRDGTIVYLVPGTMRAFGAGNSIFRGANGPEAVKTHPRFPASVNNFAYHISLETPPNGNNNASRHSGYTPNQYQSLAVLTACTRVPSDRITTHKAVDRSGSRMDPRSFDDRLFRRLLDVYLQNQPLIDACAANPWTRPTVPGNPTV